MVKPVAEDDTLIVSSSVSASDAVTNVNSLVTGGLAAVKGADGLAVMFNVVETGVKSPPSADPPSVVPSAPRAMAMAVLDVMGSAPAGSDADAVNRVEEPSVTREGEMDTSNTPGVGTGVSDTPGSVMETEVGTSR